MCSWGRVDDVGSGERSRARMKCCRCEARKKEVGMEEIESNEGDSGTSWW